MATERSEVIDALDHLIRGNKDYQLKQLLIHIRRDIYNYRTFKWRHLSEKPALQPLLSTLEKYQKRFQDRKDHRSAYLTAYENSLTEDRRELQILVKEPALLKGLQMASQSLLQRVVQYREARPDQMNKKRRQTEKSLLKYLSRIALKTSPFSHFTTLGATQGQQVLGVKSGQVLLNNHLFGLLRDVLQRYAPFAHQLPLQLNPTLERHEEKYVYLLNARNVESFQESPKDALFEFIIECFNNLKSILYPDLVKKILEVVDAEEAQISGLITELVDYGFLQFKWPFSALDTSWPTLMSERLSLEDQHLTALRETLLEMSPHRFQFSNLSLEQRAQLQMDWFQRLKAAIEPLLQLTGLAESQQEVNLEQLKYYRSAHFAFQPEKLFYEDCGSTEFVPPSTELKTQIAGELNRLVDILQPLYFNRHRSQVLQFFKSSYALDSQIGLLDFYRAYYQNNGQIEPVVPALIKRRTVWRDQLLEQAKTPDHQTIRLDWEDFMDLPGASDVSGRSHPFRAALCQFGQTESVWWAFCEHTFPGYGKMAGRFFSLFPDEVLRTQLEWNQACQKNDTLWAENLDASLYNPNVHPNFTPFEISMPGSQNRLPVTQQLPVGELTIRYHAAQDRLELIRPSDQKEVVIFDLGFEAPESRSPLFRMLNTFSYTMTSPEILVKLLNEVLLQEHEDGWRRQYRIQIGDHLIIQREGWWIPKAVLPQVEAGELAADYFLRLQSWQSMHGLPDQCFLSLTPSAAPNSKQLPADAYKPQYFDFSAPILLPLWRQLLGQVDTYLKIEEYLPLPTEQNTTEYLLQWKV